MEKISIRNLGPITEADITFGDLTILVGPQASGKSVFLQIVALLTDNNWIRNQLKTRGYVWNDMQSFLEIFLGEGMSQIFTSATRINYDNSLFSETNLIYSDKDLHDKRESIYIPAQRIIVLQNGWPKPFIDYGNDPFVVKSFSETIRLMMETINSPMFDNYDLNDAMYRSIFYEGKVEIDVANSRKRFVLNIGKNKMPFNTWSAGQKEFMPLLLGLNLLLSKGYFAKTSIKTVIIEEPEMGLHPAAIKQVIVTLLELIQHGYKVIISSHSPVFLEFAWAFQFLKQGKANDEVLYELFDTPSEERFGKVFKGIFQKSVRTYYFDKQDEGVFVKDISTLDAGSENPLVAEWGGLSTFASKAGEIVAKYGPDEE